ncbi:uncharacterized protein LOC135217211 [Macrobrachium nipponense]|uniref:uncharacterized protein LOC135217211 n=1 Tax=Macrobrachium nipponense TaxID=159736 RepID=UPI0030C8C1E7
MDSDKIFSVYCYVIIIESTIKVVLKQFRNERLSTQGIWHHCSIAFRAGTLLRGHHTNNFCESTMCIIKDIVLSRCKAYNTAQLLTFMVEMFDVYMRQRLVDVALSRRHVKPIISTKVALDSVELVGNSKYKVQSESDPTIKYDVDPEIGLCSCMQGQTGAICKHQIACAKFSMTAVPQQFLSSSESRHRLAVMAVGQEKVPDVAFFRKLNEDGGFEITGKAEIKEIDSEKTENLDMEEEPQDPISRTETMSSSDADDFASRKISRDVADAIVRVSARYRNSSTDLELKKFLRRLDSVKTANRMNSLLHCTGSAIRNGGAGRGKIPCQPTSITRRSTGRPRGAAPLCKALSTRSGLIGGLPL